MKINKEYPPNNEPVTQTLDSVLGEQQNTIEVTDSIDLTPRVDTAKETRIYEPRPLTPQDPVYNEIMEQFGARPVKPKYWFEEFGDYWSCSCGHINSGPTCEGCGLERDLLRKLFILHKPSDADSLLGDVASDGSDPSARSSQGAAAQEPASSDQVSNAPVVRPVSDPVPVAAKVPIKARVSKLLRGRRKLVALALLLFLLAAGGAGYYYDYALDEDADEVKHGTVSSFTDEEVYSESFVSFDTMNEDLTSDEFRRQCYIAVGDNCLKKKKYTKAVKQYKKAQDIKDGNDVIDKINAAKFAYVSANVSEGGEQMATYLSDLKKIGYPGIEEIYDKYYAWHVKIIANGSESDLKTSKKSFHRSDTVFFHISLTGGEPNEKIKLYYVLTWPGGAKETQNFNSQWKSGSKITAHFSYPVAMFGQEGKMVLKVYDSESNQELGSCSVNFTN